MVLGSGDHHAVHQHPWQLHRLRAQDALGRDPLDLHDHYAARVLYRLGDGEVLERERLLLHRDVSLLVRGGAAQEGDVYGEGLVEEVLLAVQLYHLDEVLGGHVVHLAAPEARVHEGLFPDRRDHARTPSGDLAKQVRNDALRKAVGLYLVLEGQLSQRRDEPPVPADHPPDHPLGGEVVEAPRLAVALAGCVDEGQTPRRSGLLETPLKGDGELFRKPDPDETAGRHGVAVHDHARGVLDGDYLVALHAYSSQRRPQTPKSHTVPGLAQPGKHG